MKLLFTAIVLAVIFHFVSIEDIWAGITRTDPWVWGAVLAGFLAGHVLAAFKWGLLVGQNLPFPTLVKAHFAGLAANIALPGVAGGDVATTPGIPLGYGKPGFENPFFVARGTADG